MARHYVELNSLRRNRNLYPNSFEFEVSTAQGGLQTSGISAFDPVVLSYPFYPLFSAVTFAGGSAAAPKLDVNASTISNNYINAWIEDINLGEFRQVVLYDGTTQTAYLDAPFSAGWNPADNFTIRKTKPMEYLKQLTGVGTLSEIQLDPTSNSLNDYYKGHFIWITTGAAAGNVWCITSYDGTTKMARLSKVLSGAVVLGDFYDILQFSYDNYCPLNQTSIFQQEPYCYEVELLSLIIPNRVIFSGQGGSISFMYPYVYVEIANKTYTNYGTISSNNPPANKALFRCSMLDVQGLGDSAFCRLNGEGVLQTIKFKLNDTIKFSVFLPTGEIVRSSPYFDFFSPLFSNQELQVSAMLAFRKVDP